MRSAPWFSTLVPHAARLTDAHLSDLVRKDPARATELAFRVGPIYANFARQRLDREAWAALLDVARARDVQSAIAALFNGEPVNRSEARPALHTALRSDLGTGAAARDAHAEAAATRKQIAQLVAELDASSVTDIVNVGIGGSDLGPRLALDALRHLDRGRFRVHFLSNVDGNAAAHTLRGLDPARTAAILVSKSFGTQETLLNGGVLRDWLGGGERLYAVSSRPDKAQAYGIDPSRVLPMWDWVGGRYSLWSAVGFAIALGIGMDGFERLLAGAALMDNHVRRTPVEHNLAVLHALVGIWNRNGLGYGTQAILPYDDRLAKLPAYLQQLVMESLGKRVTQEGEAVHAATVPVIWGGAGTDSQHSFFQALHQGTDTVPADFIGVLQSPHGFDENRRALHANLLAQSEAFANGAVDADAQKAYPGDRPSTMFLLDRLDAESFGALLALYEHSVYVQSVVWGINAFDQWGVELGKKIAASLLPAVAGDDVQVDDVVTQVLLREMRRGAE